MLWLFQEIKKREKYHIKDLYCFKCDKVSKHIELGQADIVKKEIEYKEELNEIEQKIYNLICDKKGNEYGKHRVLKKIYR